LSAADSAVHLALINEERREGCSYYRRFRDEHRRAFPLFDLQCSGERFGSTELTTKFTHTLFECGALSRLNLANQFGDSWLQFR
jgi:hypothetical protein